MISNLNSVPCWRRVNSLRKVLIHNLTQELITWVNEMVKLNCFFPDQIVKFSHQPTKGPWPA